MHTILQAYTYIEHTCHVSHYTFTLSAVAFERCRVAGDFKQLRTNPLPLHTLRSELGHDSCICTTPIALIRPVLVFKGARRWRHSQVEERQLHRDGELRLIKRPPLGALQEHRHAAHPLGRGLVRGLL